MTTSDEIVVARLASAPVPVGSTLMQLTVFGQVGANGQETEEVVTLRTLAPWSESAAPPIARIHSACFTGDVLGSEKCDCGPQLSASLAAIVQSYNGVLVYMLRQEGRASAWRTRSAPTRCKRRGTTPSARTSPSASRRRAVTSGWPPTACGIWASPGSAS